MRFNAERTNEVEKKKEVETPGTWLKIVLSDEPSHHLSFNMASLKKGEERERVSPLCYVFLCSLCQHGATFRTQSHMLGCRRRRHLCSDVILFRFITKSRLEFRLFLMQWK